MEDALPRFFRIRLNVSGRLLRELDSRRSEFIRNLPAAAITVVSGSMAWLVWQFLSPSTGLLYISIIGIATTLVLFLARAYLMAGIALSALVVTVAVCAATASYFVASDQVQFRYGSGGGETYFEFPSRISALDSIINLLAGARTIRIIQCGGTRVAKLPSLPFEPIFAEKDRFYGPYAFRRFPPLELEGVGLTLETQTGQASLAQLGNKHSTGIEFGYSDQKRAAVPLTQLFPRSEACLDGNVPLLPILETLPWNPEDVESLIRATAKVEYLRDLYAKGVVTIDDLHRLRLGEGDEPYKTLFDFVIGAFGHQMLSGNVLSEARADIINQMCATLNRDPAAFTGPFSSLASNLMLQIAAELGDHYSVAYPSCHVPSDTIQEVTSGAASFPWLETFRKCVDTATSIAECLNRDDVASNEQCGDGKCSNSSGRPASQERLFNIYDHLFSKVVATKDNKLVDIASIQPSECPELRDPRESTHFVNEWRALASKVITEPFKCTSPEWRQQYTESRHTYASALSCALKRGVANGATLEDADALFETIVQLRCDGMVDVHRTKIPDDVYETAANLEQEILKLRRYSEIVGQSRIDGAVSALQLFVKIRDDVCGKRDLRLCAEEFGRPENLQAFLDRISRMLGLSSLAGSNEAETFDGFAKIDNLLINIGLCDLLQDEETARKTNHKREEFCDAHGLRRYRLIGSVPVGRSTERFVDGPYGGVSYFYNMNRGDGMHGIKVPVDHF